MGISSNVLTRSLDIEVLTGNGYEIMSFLKDKEKFYYVPEHKLTIPEIKILIDALQAASFVTDKKTAELLKENMICFNTRKHTNEAIRSTVDGIEGAIVWKKINSFPLKSLNRIKRHERNSREVL